MSKLPFLQFYPADYLVDTRVLTLSARGAWVDILCVLHSSSTRGTTKFAIRGWARIMGASEADVLAALREIEDMKVGDVIRGSNGDVTVTCRRMMNESITREQSRLRVQNHRNKERNAARNASSNENVTPNKLEVISHKSETKKNTASVPAAVLVESPPDDCPFPPETAKKVKRNPSGDPLELQGIYSAYPRKVAPADALKAIAKAIAKGKTPAHLLERTKAYAAATALWAEDELRFIPHPATWFNGGRYDDDPKTWFSKSAPLSEFADAFEPDFQQHLHRINTTQQK